MKRKKIIFALIAGLVLLGSKIVFSEFEIDEKSLYEQIPLLTDTITYIKKYYVSDISARELIYGALEGMLDALDPYSEFLPPERYEGLKTETKGEFGGLGIVVSKKDGMLVIITPMEGTPAEKAGVKAEDIILEVDGVSSKDISFSDAVEKMRGKPGTKVELTIIRGDEKKLLKFSITRAIIEIENIKDAMIISDTIGYVRVVDFGEKTQKGLMKALKELESQGATSLILDLRNNPGGLLEAAVAVCHMFLEQGDLIVYTKGRDGEEQMRFEAKRKYDFTFEPLVILVNKGSASGSEIVAGALKDNKRALIIGQKTFGKASVQTVVPLRDKSAIRLTTAHYYTPSGVSIHGKGIQPDIEVEYHNYKIEAMQRAQASGADNDENADVENDESPYDEAVRKEYLLADSQVQRALDVIKGIAVWDTLKKE